MMYKMQPESGTSQDVQVPVAILGCGLIGISWAALFLHHGINVRAWDPNPAARNALSEKVKAAMAQLADMGPPAIRLCLVHPGRGRAARRRTAASSCDAIETRDGGWCWTSQTAIGWGPLPKRALAR